MNLIAPLRALAFLSFALFLLAEALSAHCQLTSSGYPITNRKWEILITDYGYADLALDRRKGFKGREYLSGEWASAIYYSGGRNPAGPIWFQPQWYYPDWVSNSDFGVEKTFGVGNPMSPTNMHGYNVYSSVITNRDLRVTMNYEMLRLGTNESEQLALGLVGSSSGGSGSNLFSGRHLFRQKFDIENISGGMLDNLKFYHLLHGLESGWGAYDDRDYGGALSDYRFRLTQQGNSYSFDSRTMETVEHTDTMSACFNVQPSGYELGFYGVKGADDHVSGKPATGVHLSVEQDAFNSMDYFNPSGTGWVSGALRFNLGSLQAGASTNISCLLGINTLSEVKYPPINLVVHSVRASGDTLLIDFEELTRNPQVGYLLRRSPVLGQQDPSEWEPVGIPYFSNLPLPGWNRFRAPIESEKPRMLFFIQPQIIQIQEEDF